MNVEALNGSTYSPFQSHIIVEMAHLCSTNGIQPTYIEWDFWKIKGRYTMEHQKIEQVQDLNFGDND